MYVFIISYHSLTEASWCAHCAARRSPPPHRQPAPTSWSAEAWRHSRNWAWPQLDRWWLRMRSDLRREQYLQKKIWIYWRSILWFQRWWNERWSTGACCWWLNTASSAFAASKLLENDASIRDWLRADDALRSADDGVDVRACMKYHWIIRGPQFFVIYF